MIARFNRPSPDGGLNTPSVIAISVPSCRTFSSRLGKRTSGGSPHWTFCSVFFFMEFPSGGGKLVVAHVERLLTAPWSKELMHLGTSHIPDFLVHLYRRFARMLEPVTRTAPRSCIVGETLGGSMGCPVEANAPAIPRLTGFVAVKCGFVAR